MVAEKVVAEEMVAEMVVVEVVVEAAACMEISSLSKLLAGRVPLGRAAGS